MPSVSRPPASQLQRFVVAIATIISVGLVASACGFTVDEAAAEVASAPATATTTADESVMDPSVVHDIAVSFDEDAYDAMIDVYAASGDKQWIEATVMIDGVTYEQVGLRLKGNSSLRGLGDDRAGEESMVSADDPSGLPWLIRFDKYVEGQNHDGLSDVVIRSNNTETSLNEAVALDLLELAGLASQDAIAVAFSVNGSESTLRLAIEHPDDVWMGDNFADDGALYKAESTGDYSFRGDDPEAYDEVFDQEAGRENEDLAPLIEFLDFINNTDDATFIAELADHLDVESFASYLAMQDLIDNFDDINGPGNNSYLSHDSETGIFTEVAWDHNLAFGIRNNDGLGPGGGPGGGPAGGPGVTSIRGSDGEQPPGAGLQPPAGGPTEAQLPEAGLPAGRPGEQANVLVDRFLANPEFSALYDAALVELDASLYENGIAAEVLATWVSVLETSDLVTIGTIDEESAQIAAYFGN